MKKTLYLECYSGISGDMTVAALLDLGADRKKLDQALKSLPLTGFCTEISRVTKSGLEACDFNVILEVDNHDHDTWFEYGLGISCMTGKNNHFYADIERSTGGSIKKDWQWNAGMLWTF